MYALIYNYHVRCDCGFKMNTKLWIWVFWVFSLDCGFQKGNGIDEIQTVFGILFILLPSDQYSGQVKPPCLFQSTQKRRAPLFSQEEDEESEEEEKPVKRTRNSRGGPQKEPEESEEEPTPRSRRGTKPAAKAELNGITKKKKAKVVRSILNINSILVIQHEISPYSLLFRKLHDTFDKEKESQIGMWHIENRIYTFHTT